MGGDQLDEVKRLFALRQKGFLTEVEFQAEKRRTLGTLNNCRTASGEGDEKPLELTTIYKSESVFAPPARESFEQPLELDTPAPRQHAAASDLAIEGEDRPRVRFDPSGGGSTQLHGMLAVLTLLAAILIASLTIGGSTGGTVTSSAESRVTRQVEITQPLPLISDADLKRWLVGSWAYGDDCNTDFGIEYLGDGRWDSMYGKGTWNLYGVSLTEKTTAKCDPADGCTTLHPATTRRLKVERLGESTLKFHEADGSSSMAVRCKGSSAAPHTVDGATSALTGETAAALDTPQNPSAVEQWSSEENEIIASWNDLNGRCRGGSGDDPATMAACEQRDGSLARRMAQAKICYGADGQYPPDYRIHRCGPKSYGLGSQN